MTCALAVCVSLLLLGCSSSDPTLYTLGQRPGVSRPGPRQLVAVREITVPRYLERQGIVHRDGDRLVVADNDWWGETLSTMVRRVLVGDLAQRLPGADVLNSDGIGGERPDVEVEIDLNRFEPDENGQVVMDGVAALKQNGRPRTLEKVMVQIPDPGRTTRSQVGAMSDALGRAADAIAARIIR